jgi:hypothetical protein
MVELTELNLTSLPALAQWKKKPPFRLADLKPLKKAYKENLENQSLIQAKLADAGDSEQYADLEKQQQLHTQMGNQIADILKRIEADLDATPSKCYGITGL